MPRKGEAEQKLPGPGTDDRVPVPGQCSDPVGINGRSVSGTVVTTGRASRTEARRFIDDLERRLAPLDRHILLAEWKLVTGRSMRGSATDQTRRHRLLSFPGTLERDPSAPGGVPTWSSAAAPRAGRSSGPGIPDRANGGDRPTSSPSPASDRWIPAPVARPSDRSGHRTGGTTDLRGPEGAGTGLLCRGTLVPTDRSGPGLPGGGPERPRARARVSVLPGVPALHGGVHGPPARSADGGRPSVRPAGDAPKERTVRGPDP